MPLLGLFIISSLILAIYLLCREAALEYSFKKMRKYIKTIVKGEDTVYDFNQPVLYYKWLDKEIAKKWITLFKIWVPIKKYEMKFKKELYFTSIRSIVTCQRELKKEVYLK